MTDFWYNMSSVTGDNGVLGMAQGVNTVFFFNLFGMFILITLFVIIFRAMHTYNNNPRVSFMFTSFFIAFLSILFKLLYLANDTTVFISVAMFAISILLMFILE